MMCVLSSCQTMIYDRHDTRALADDRGTEHSGRGRPAGDGHGIYSAGICKVFPVTAQRVLFFFSLVDEFGCDCFLALIIW